MVPLAAAIEDPARPVPVAFVQELLYSVVPVYTNYQVQTIGHEV
jgi:hypothetical protein